MYTHCLPRLDGFNSSPIKSKNGKRLSLTSGCTGQLLAVEAGGDALGWYWYTLLGYKLRGCKGKQIMAHLTYFHIYKTLFNNHLTFLAITKIISSFFLFHVEMRFFTNYGCTKTVKFKIKSGIGLQGFKNFCRSQLSVSNMFK